MKRLLLFLFFATLGTSALVYIAGGIHGRPKIEREAKLPVSPHAPGSRPSIETPDGQLDIESARNITQMAPPMRIVWKDRLSDETITIDNFQRWRCTARSVNPLPLAATGGQGALLGDVLFETYRDPETRAEAMALRDTTGEERYATLLHQRLRAGEARVTGKLGEAMAARRSGNAADRSLGDTALELSRDIVLEDKGQNLVIRGGEGASLTVYPEQDRARGKGPFSLEHDAVHMTGNGLVLDRNLERHYIRVEITRDPRLRIQKASKGEGGKPLFDFGEGDFQPTTVTSAGRAILEREMLRRETVMTVTFHDRVYAAQLGGRTLNAGRANLVAFTNTLPTAKSSGWKLRRFHADRHVTIHYPGRTKKDEAFLATVDAERLRYDIPEDGSEPTTVLEEDVDIRMRGEIAMLGTGGMLRATCRERAWIGPLPDGAPDGGLDRLLLRQISLRGAARLERVTTAQESTGDLIAAEAIDVIAWPRGSNAAGDGEPRAPLAPGESTRMTAVHFAAVGDVRLEGAQIRGDTARIVADDLHTETPRVFAEGEGTRFTFRQLAGNQGILGPSTGTKGSATDSNGRSADDDKDGRWMLDRIVARGAVDIDTTLGGPALGIPAHLQGDEITYDGLSRIARIRALGGEPVRIGWTAAGSKTNQIETRTLTLDRAAGRITAEGGVEGELYLARRGGGGGFGMPGMSAGVGPSLNGAELTVSTDKRVDLILTSQPGRATPKPGVQQWIRIAGPVTTELRSSSRVVDRMRSDSLEVALSYRDAEETADDTASVPSAAAGRQTAPKTQPRTTPEAQLERVDVTAGSVRVDLSAGEPRYMVADGGVDLKSRDGHLMGQRLTYDGTRRRIELHAGTTPARALLGTTAQRSEVQAQRMVVDLLDGRVGRLEAHAPTGRTSDIHIYRDVPAKPGAVEWFALTYQGNVVMTDASLLTQRVRLIRRLRAAGSQTFGEAVTLRAPRVIVSGHRMLTTDEKVRNVAMIEALEFGTGPGSEVNLVYGQGADQTELWGHRLVVDVGRQRARLEGKPGRDLRIRRGGRLTMDQQSVELDLTSNLPTFIPGSRIHWKPGRK